MTAQTFDDQAIDKIFSLQDELNAANASRAELLQALKGLRSKYNSQRSVPRGAEGDDWYSGNAAAYGAATDDIDALITAIANAERAEREGK